jgi:hypothetical protein
MWYTHNYFQLCTKALWVRKYLVVDRRRAPSLTDRRSTAKPWRFFKRAAGGKGERGRVEAASLLLLEPLSPQPPTSCEIEGATLRTQRENFTKIKDPQNQTANTIFITTWARRGSAPPSSQLGHTADPTAQASRNNTESTPYHSQGALPHHRRKEIPGAPPE